MKTKSLVLDRRNVLRKQEIKENNELIDALINQKLLPDDIRVKRNKIETLQLQINELDWVLEAK